MNVCFSFFQLSLRWRERTADPPLHGFASSVGITRLEVDSCGIPSGSRGGADRLAYGTRVLWKKRMRQVPACFSSTADSSQVSCVVPEASPIDPWVGVGEPSEIGVGFDVRLGDGPYEYLAAVVK
ncbi:MAG: hypothetical protein QOK38_2724 [Acidobacteriaceae bacterium]|nr:hypothetical protein [Acidobacteriaceae bacterium]